MEFQQIVQRASQVRARCADLERKRYGAAWSREELALGFVGDVGDLAKLVVAAEGRRSIADADAKLAHELSDCLWSVIALAEAHGIDLERAFLNTMNDLDTWLDKELAEV
jgi:NTP pyrophosphatase (non-canonical NTP hydrolase)